ncbi:hypothetical protein AAY473_023314 [Plecturocebus cupreus]
MVFLLQPPGWGLCWAVAHPWYRAVKERKTGSCSVSQAGVQWYKYSSLQPGTPGLKGSSRSASQVARTTGSYFVTHDGTIKVVCLPSSSDPPPISASRVAGTTGGFIMLPRLLLNSWAQVIPTLAFQSPRIRGCASKSCLDIHVHSSIIHNSQKVEATQVCISRTSQCVSLGPAAAPHLPMRGFQLLCAATKKGVKAGHKWLMPVISALGEAKAGRLLEIFGFWVWILVAATQVANPLLQGWSSLWARRSGSCLYSQEVKLSGSPEIRHTLAKSLPLLSGPLVTSFPLRHQACSQSPGALRPLLVAVGISSPVIPVLGCACCPPFLPSKAGYRGRLLNEGL